MSEQLAEIRDIAEGRRPVDQQPRPERAVTPGVTFVDFTSQRRSLGSERPGDKPNNLRRAAAGISVKESSSVEHNSANPPSQPRSFGEFWKNILTKCREQVHAKTARRDVRARAALKERMHVIQGGRR